ncbi:carbohydrate ABC transporter permease [Neobacillus sp. PS3-34]|uniref:carbohydrate ABC transporter permease n=1 Tax=Neobacillus sp. PS3-34 TaxID=3070678 RepID=UPI0027DEBDAB|nr:carbohydrate ABC transporter permease [Neobacillus sp. PS3-34]WML48309.1 carbohydrate ABC transporter permease [Neobacillus sp. PS3-34]
MNLSNTKVDNDQLNNVQQLTKKSYKPKINPHKKSKIIYQTVTIIFTLIAIIFAILTLYPFIFSVIASLRKGLDVYSSGWSFSDLTLYSYKKIIFGFSDEESVKLTTWLLNTAFVSIVTTLLTLLVSALGGYALARIEFPGKKTWFALILGVMMIPGQITLIPKYIMIANFFGWTNSYTGLIVPFIFSAYFTFMMRQFFLSFPKEVEEAAILDGMSRMGVFFNMVLPLSKAPMLAAGILIFMGSWGSYLWPKILISKMPMYLISQGMTVMMGGRYTSTPSVQMATAIVSTLPLILLFVIFQKHFMGSIAKTGTKGV